MNKFIEENFIIKKDYEEVIRILGVVLIGLGFLDIIIQAFMFQGGSVNLDFNLLPIIIGSLLIRGNLKAIRVTMFIFGSYILFTLLSFVLSFIFIPFDYSWLLLRERFYNQPLPLIFSFLFFIIYSWAFLNLTGRIVVTRLIEKGHKFIKPWEKAYAGMVIGALIAFIMMIMLTQMLRGENAGIAIEKMREKYGNNYRYTVTSMNIRQTKEKKVYTAQVAAYNNEQIKYITVEW